LQSPDDASLMVAASEVWAAEGQALSGLGRAFRDPEETLLSALGRATLLFAPIARALAGGATAVVGLLVGSLADFWNQELVRAVQRELYAAARSTLVADADGEPARELELARRLLDQRVDGLVVVPIGPASGDWASIAREVATVTIGDALPGVRPAGEVIFDYERGVRESLEHLNALGHRRITVLSWAVETSPDRQAERAVTTSAAALGLDCRVVACAYSLNGSRPLALELLRTHHAPQRIARDALGKVDRHRSAGGERLGQPDVLVGEARILGFLVVRADHSDRTVTEEHRNEDAGPRPHPPSRVLIHLDVVDQ